MRIFVLAVTLALASVLEAQNAREYAVLYPRRITKAALAQAVRECDRKVLWVPCDEVVRKAEEMFPHVGKGNLQFADYIQGLEERACPVKASIRTSEWMPATEINQPQGRLVVGRHYMECESGEVLLWDKDLGKPVISLYDGNLVESYLAPDTKVAAQGAAPPATQTNPPKSGAPTQPAGVTRARPDINIPVGGKDRGPTPGPEGKPGAPGTD